MILSSKEQKVSLPTIIKRAKEWGFYKSKQKKRKSHNREVLTNYVDSHSIFRFVQGRDSLWRHHYLLTDGVDT